MSFNRKVQLGELSSCWEAEKKRTFNAVAKNGVPHLLLFGFFSRRSTYWIWFLGLGDPHFCGVTAGVVNRSISTAFPATSREFGPLQGSTNQRSLIGESFNCREMGTARIKFDEWERVTLSNTAERYHFHFLFASIPLNLWAYRGLYNWGSQPNMMCGLKKQTALLAKWRIEAKIIEMHRLTLVSRTH